MPRFVLFMLVALTALSGAQDCTQTVPVRLVDKNTGAMIEPLTADMVTARTGQFSLPISAATRIPTGRLIVLIDESGSMNDSETTPLSSYQKYALGTVKQTLSGLMTELPAGVSVEYGLFSDKWVFGGTFVSNPDEVRKSIDEATARFGKRGQGYTAMRDALHEALVNFGRPQPGDSILLVTDGVDNHSKVAAKKLEQDFRAAHTRLLTMTVTAFSPTPEEASSRESLRDLVEKTGGSSLVIDVYNPSWAFKKENPNNIETVRRFWNDWVLVTDAIQIHVPATLTKDVKWTVSPNQEAGRRLKHVGVVYPTLLSPCAVAIAGAH